MTVQERHNIYNKTKGYCKGLFLSSGCTVWSAYPNTTHKVHPQSADGRGSQLPAI